MAEPRNSDTRVPRRIQGYKQSQRPARGFGGLDEYYALQRPGVSAFQSTSPGGAPSAGELASMARDSGLSIDRRGSLQPLGYSQFREMINQRNQSPGLRTDVSTVPGPTGAPLAVPSFSRTSSPSTTVAATPAGPTPEQNRASLMGRAQGLGLLRQTQQNQSGIVSQDPMNPGGRILTSRYGTGSSSPTARPGGGLINGRPASEVLQGIANAQGRAGTSRPGDRFQPQRDMTPGEDERLRKMASATRITSRRNT